MAGTRACVSELELVHTRGLKDLPILKAHDQDGREDSEICYLMTNPRWKKQDDEEKNSIASINNIGLKQDVGQVIYNYLYL